MPDSYSGDRGFESLPRNSKTPPTCRNMKPKKISRVILVHGFNVKDGGAGTTGRLAKKFEAMDDVEVVVFAPGWRGLIGVRVSNKRRAQQLAELIRPDDLLIGHSDGCNLIDLACHELSSLGDESVNCVYFNPALDRDTALSRIVRKCLVFHTLSDRVVWISRFLLLHPWGQMGRKGYKAKRKELHDPRYRNRAFEDMGHHGLKHSGVFASPIALNDSLAHIEIEFTEIPKAIPVEES